MSPKSCKKQTSLLFLGKAYFTAVSIPDTIIQGALVWLISLGLKWKEIPPKTKACKFFYAIFLAHWKSFMVEAQHLIQNVRFGSPTNLNAYTTRLGRALHVRLLPTVSKASNGIYHVIEIDKSAIVTVGNGYEQSKTTVYFVCKRKTFLYLETCRTCDLTRTMFCVNHMKNANLVCNVSYYTGTVLQWFERQETNDVLEKLLNFIEERKNSLTKGRISTLEKLLWSNGEQQERMIMKMRHEQWKNTINTLEKAEV